MDVSSEKGKVDVKSIKNTYPDIIFSVENNLNRISRALNECHLRMYHDSVKDLVLRTE